MSLHDELVLYERRRVLAILGGATLLCACDSRDLSSVEPTTTTFGTTPPPQEQTPQATACSTLPEETAGPYPADGSNGPNALAESGIVRSDIRSSFGAMKGTAEGVPLTIELRLVDASAGCAPLAGYAIYVWHCDRDGQYSLYNLETENYLRGVQSTDANGVVRFVSIFPAAYSGRWPHIHFEVYPNEPSATSSTHKLATSQIALPEGACREVYGQPGYEASLTNLSETPLASDTVFADDASTQLANVTGDVTNGYTATLTIGVGAR